MARNLVKESQGEESIKEAITAKPSSEETKTDKEIVVMTAEQVILNNLNVIMNNQNEMFIKMIEGFKQVGVKYEDIKKE